MMAVLIATLGAEPQVITLATQTLLHQGDALSAVVVLHTHAAYEPVATALPPLQNCFANQPTWPPFQPVLVPVDDVLEPVQFDQFSQTLYTVLKTWIAQPARIHLLLAGERYSLRITGLTAGVSQALEAAFLTNPPPTWTVAEQTLQVAETICDAQRHSWTGRTTYETLAATQLLQSEKLPRTATLEFASPTAFKSGGMTVPVPMPNLVFGSLVERWNHFSPG